MMGFGRSLLLGAGRQLLPAIGLLFLEGLGGASAATLRATLDRNVVPVGESVTLSIVFDGVGAAEMPTLPPIPNVTVSPGTSQRSEFIFDNGQRSSRIIYDFQLVATRAGDTVIPAIQGRAGGAALTSQPLSLKIVNAEGAAAAAQAALTNLAFLRLIVPKTEVYVGEPFAVEMQLYWQTAQDVHVPQLDADGFSFGPMAKPNQTRTQVGNGIYNLVICRLTATAARTGTLPFGPAESSLTIFVPIPNSGRGRDPFGFFGRGPDYQQRPTVLKSDTVTMKVLPLPKENVPVGFNGAIGNYRMTASAGPTNLVVGDPITVRVQIAGNGPIENLQLPAQADWRDFTTYPATAKTDVNDLLGLSGVKSFEQVVIPLNHEIKALPPLRFSFFDPQARAYRTLSSPAVPLEIRPAATAAAPPIGLTNDAAGGTPPPADDIVHIRPRLDAARPVASLLVAQPWFLGAQGAPVLLWISLLVWRKRVELLANNPRLRRQREVAARVRVGLKELRAHAVAQKSVEFFATLFHLLQEQLGERLDLPASAITEAVIDERLRGSIAPDEVLKPLRELFQTCNAARYAPTTSSQELAALIPKLEGVLRDLQRLKA